LRDQIHYVYMLTNCSRRPIYTGNTNAMIRRHTEHKEQAYPDSYSAQYNLYRLVYVEKFKYVKTAIAREKQIKRWRREKKIRLIESVNPKWDDLSRKWGMPIDFEEIVRRAEEFQNQGPSAPRAETRSARDDKFLVVKKKL
jgi:putative endonuclease